MPPKKKAKAAATVAAATSAATRPVAERGTYKAEKLTGARAVRGKKAGTGEPNFVYEVKWVGYAARENTWEPADNLIGWEAEMRAIDEKYEIRDAQSFVSVAGAAQAAREAAAKQKMAFEHADAGSAVPEAAEAPPRPVSPQPVTRAQPKVGRNDPCPCGSGKKYKQCHGALS